MARKKAQEQEPSGTVRREIVIKEIECELTPEELDTATAQLTAGMIEIERAEDCLKDYAKEAKKEIKQIKSNVRQLRDMVNSRSELRPVKCEAVFDYEDDSFTVTRQDTNEVIEIRCLSETEKQMVLDFDSDGDEGENDSGVEVIDDNEDEQVECVACKGSGTQDDGVTDCYLCEGTGFIME